MKLLNVLSILIKIGVIIGMIGVIIGIFFLIVFIVSKFTGLTVLEQLNAWWQAILDSCRK